MFKTLFVVWLVLLVLVSSVVSFVTRFVEKRRLDNRFSKSRINTWNVANQGGMRKEVHEWRDASKSAETTG